MSSLTYQQDLEEEDDEREAGTASLGLIREDTEPALRASSSGKVSTLRQRSSNTEERRVSVHARSNDENRREWRVGKGWGWGWEGGSWEGGEGRGGEGVGVIIVI